MSYFDSGTPVRRPLRSSSSDWVAEIYCTQIELRESHTDRLNHWIIKPVMALSSSAVPGLEVSSAVTGHYSIVCGSNVALIIRN